MTAKKYIPRKRCRYCRRMRPIYLIESHERQCKPTPSPADWNARLLELVR